MSNAAARPPLTHKPESTNIRHIEYHPDEQRLVVEFHNGGKYAYDGVPADLHERFIKAPSAGTFFQTQIRKGVDNQGNPFTGRKV